MTTSSPYLGMHRAPGGLCVRAMLPRAEKIAVVDSATGDIAGEGVRIHLDALFVATLGGRREPIRYRLPVLSGDIENEFEDIYRFSPVLGELDIRLLVEGNLWRTRKPRGDRVFVANNELVFGEIQALLQSRRNRLPGRWCHARFTLGSRLRL